MRFFKKNKEKCPTDILKNGFQLKGKLKRLWNVNVKELTEWKIISNVRAKIYAINNYPRRK